MRSGRRLVAIIVFVSLSLSPIIAVTAPARPQQGRAFEQLVAMMRDQLSLDENQIEELRKILIAHASKFAELRSRTQTQPYDSQYITDLLREQRTIKDELAAHLSEDQKKKLESTDLRLPVPPPPPFVAINIPPRPADKRTDLAATEPIVPWTPKGAKARTARLNEDQKVLHLLSRATFGPRPGDFERVRRTGISRFLDEQLNSEMIDDAELEARLKALPTMQMTAAEMYQFYPPQNVVEQRAKQPNPPPVYGRPQQAVVELVQQKLVRAVASNRQLQEVMTDFWFNHFNVFAQKGADLWNVTSYERDVIRPHALSKFSELIEAVAESPAMLFYLDNWLSSSPDARGPRPANAQPPRPQPAPGAAPGADSAAMIQRPNNPQPPPPPRGINENYARELLELHTLGVDGGYTQKDVQEVARCFTGWTIDRPFQGGGFVFRPWMHDAGAKTVLGVTIPAGGGISDGKRVLELLARHPSTARFLSKKLCMRFVADEPPTKLVDHIAQVYLKTDGDIRQVLRAVFTSAEFNSVSAFRSKVKSPLELAASAIRAVGGDTNGAPALHEWLRRSGQPLYQNPAPTGYGEDSRFWVNTGVFFNRLNFLVALANNQIAGTRFDPSRLISNELAASVDEATSKLAALIVHTDLSADSLRAVRTGLEEQTASAKPAVIDDRALKQAVGEGPAIMQVSSNSPLDPSAARRVSQIVGLLMGTTEFQRK
jgi:uncharacterized protein (DUF1800 family)